MNRIQTPNKPDDPQTTTTAATAVQLSGVVTPTIDLPASSMPSAVVSPDGSISSASYVKTGMSLTGNSASVASANAQSLLYYTSSPYPGQQVSLIISY